MKLILRAALLLPLLVASQARPSPHSAGKQLVPAGQHGRSLSSEDTAEPTVIFGGPTVGGVPLDFCLTFGAGCGEEAARYFCQALQGFANVSEYQLAGQYANRTYIPSSGTFCEDKNCQTFESITCTGSVEEGPRFESPVVHGIGLPLDWCLRYGEQCGEDAASYFCQRRGYGTVASFAMETWRVPPATYLPAVGEMCITGVTIGGGCNSFSFIECADPLGPLFTAPTVGGVPLDWCLHWGSDCGLPAAQYFCEEQGYSGVADYKMADAVPDVTVLPASGQTCETTGNNPGGCNTFDYILCGAPSS